uniref:FYVE-type domain-containing protein n=1 Tax=Neobodo designis TaxID=312471 RepID=A0A7S1PJX7_NEODS|mmetsp:Transcript_110/g.413  ORF Transcript_110/g.413 Transcript_110/m.413 type:complete len:573 (+) Transcript_110:95-1813(+)|eukprot:CAMPEP_0174854868 /NCGR_PEP_ID=MMETSP1114-20130205/31989_1 /TAXON_ID=312471 /ORGANISM="Neobodo designis, Strain CCAP 1951/1" /LENGTH=572 /DNA_ID=CAMNT_0016089579 /DNA_START=95 /DNA_END=1813 /DNA_ORIENTATION=-
MLSGLVNKGGGRISKGQQDEVLKQIRDNERGITVVDCGKELEEDFVAELCRALRTNRYVTTLRIRDRELSTSVDPLAALCSRTTTLVTLKVSYANLGDQDAIMICGAVIKNKSIQSLSLDHNRISKADAITLLLLHNKTLDSLDLSFNHLSDSGDKEIVKIADALGRNSTLKQLYLSGNGLSDAAARHLVEVVDKNLVNMRLRVLDIAAENSVRSETKQALKLVLEAGRTAGGGRGTDGDDDLRSQLTGMGLTSTAGVLTGAPMPPPGGDEGISAADVEAWQAQVDTGTVPASAFDDERKELQATIDRLRDEKDAAVQAQVSALEQANKMQQQVALLTERHAGVKRELDAVSTKYDRKVKESAEQLQSLQAQLTAARKELVRQQEASAADRATLVALQESMTSELTRVHDQLSAATKANDLLEHLAPPTARRPITVDTGVITDLAGANAKNALAKKPASAGAPSHPRTSRPSTEDDTWSHSTGADVSVGVAGRRAQAAAAGQALAIPTPMPRNQWMDDDSAHDCKSCRREFTITRRKHHCRLCGQLFCNSCATENKAWGMRVCTYCLATHTQ